MQGSRLGLGRGHGTDPHRYRISGDAREGSWGQPEEEAKGSSLSLSLSQPALGLQERVCRDGAAPIEILSFLCFSWLSEVGKGWIVTAAGIGWYDEGLQWAISVGNKWRLAGWLRLSRGRQGISADLLESKSLRILIHYAQRLADTCSRSSKSTTRWPT